MEVFGVGKMGEDGQQVQTSSFKWWSCNVQQGEYSE